MPNKPSRRPATSPQRCLCGGNGFLPRPTHDTNTSHGKEGGDTPKAAANEWSAAAVVPSVSP